MTRIAVLGATGSIGRQTLDVAAQHPDRLKVVALTANASGDALKEAAAKCGAPRLALMSEQAAEDHGLPGGMEAVIDCATADNVDLVVVAVAGVIGLRPTLAAIEAGKDIALASKEVLVAAGESVMPLVQEKGIKLTPIDSEHSAIFQCLEGAPAGSVKTLVLTASGGPFRGKSREDLAGVSTEEVLNHPTWRMGGKITVDSATLMNKGLEVIEARWLFGIPPEQIEVVVHPQSIIHSMVRFSDGSVLGQLGWPDMRLPIQYALLHPHRVPNEQEDWNPVETPNLTFEEPDRETFRCLPLAFRSLEMGGTAPCALNAANEEAANALLKGECGFLQIAQVVADVLEEHTPQPATLENVFAVDQWAREAARRKLGS